MDSSKHTVVTTSLSAAWSELMGGYNTSDTVTKHTGYQIRTMT